MYRLGSRASTQRALVLFRVCLIRSLVLCGAMVLAACQRAITRSESPTAGFVAELPALFIMGSSRGIGLLFAQYDARAGWNAIASGYGN